MSRADDLRMVGELVGRSAFSLFVEGGTIELRRRRSLGLTAARLVVTLFLLPFLLAPLLLLLEPQIPFNVPAALFYLVWYGTLIGFAWFIGSALFRWRLVRVDGSRGRLELSGSGRLLWLPRRIAVPFHAVRELRLRLGPEGLRPTPFIWRLVYGERGRGRRTLAVGATVEAIDRRDEALDLTARVARLMGWKAYALTRGDQLGAEVRFARSEAELAEPREIPPLEAEPDYREDEASDGWLPAEPELPPFDPDGYEGLEEVEAWEPGRRVVLAVRPFTRRQTVLAVLAAGLFFGLPIAALLWMLSLALPEPARPWLLFGLAQSVLTAAAVVAFLAWRSRQTRRVELDWSAGRLRLKKGDATRAVALGDVRSLEVRGRRTAGGPGRHAAPLYRCEVLALLGSGAAGEGPIPLLEVQERGDRDGPYRQAAGFAAEIARELGVEWSWTGYARG